jgi:hypothetical protein
MSQRASSVPIQWVQASPMESPAVEIAPPIASTGQPYNLKLAAAKCTADVMGFMHFLLGSLSSAKGQMEKSRIPHPRWPTLLAADGIESAEDSPFDTHEDRRFDKVESGELLGLTSVYAVATRMYPARAYSDTARAKSGTWPSCGCLYIVVRIIQAKINSFSTSCMEL